MGRVMGSRTCASCGRRLPEDHFHRAGGKRRPECRPCHNDAQRAASPLPPLKRDPALIRINNAVALWHGPVQRTQLLRNAA